MLKSLILRVSVLIISVVMAIFTIIRCVLIVLFSTDDYLYFMGEIGRLQAMSSKMFVKKYNMSMSTCNKNAVEDIKLDVDDILEGIDK